MFKNIILLFLLLLPSAVFGTNWVDEFPIYINGDVSFIAQVYEFVWRITKDESVELFVGLGITITLIIAAFYLKDADFWKAGKTIAASAILLILFYTPTSSVHIVDKRVDKGMISGHLSPDGGYQKVDNIPYAIAFLPATVTFVIHIFIEIIDNGWDSVHIANKLSGTGFRESDKTLFNVASIKELYTNEKAGINGDLQHNLDQYLDKCILKKAILIGGAGNNNYFKSSENIFPEMINPSKFPTDFGSEYVTLDSYNGGIGATMSCQAAYNNIAANKSKYEEAAEWYLRNKEPNKNFSSASFNEGVLGVAASKVGDLKKATLTTLTAKRLQHMTYKDSVGLDGYNIARDLTIESTLNNIALEGPAKYSWIAKVLPELILILTGIGIASYPLFVLVQFFMGMGAYKATLNYFMGFFALYFNFVGLALVQNIISYYEKQEALKVLAEMPFSSSNIEEFLLQQAQTTGLAGIVGAAACLVLTPLIIYGEWKGLNGAINGVTGAFRGDLVGTSQKQMNDYAVEAEIDKRNQMTEADANSWLEENGFTPRDNQTSLQMFNDIQRGVGAAASGLTAKDIMHSGNMSNFMEGSYGQSTQQSMRTVGFGDSIAGNISSVSDVSMQDGQVMAETMKATDSMRKERGYNTEDIGTGMAAAQYAKDMGASFTGSRIGSDMSSDNKALSALVASSVDQSLKQLSAGKGLIDSLAYDKNGNLKSNSQAELLEEGYANQARAQANLTMGAGKENLSGPQGIEKMNNLQHLGHAQFQGQIGRGAASRDALLEDSNYYAKANEWGERSSIAQTKGSMKAYGADKDFDEGLESMAQAVQDDSMTKAYGQMKGMEKARKEGLINPDGSLSDSGEMAFALQSTDAIGALVGKGNIGDNIDKAMEHIYNEAFEQGKSLFNENIDKAKEHAESRIAPFMSDGKVNYNEDGKVNTDNALKGIDFWNKNAELKAGSFSGSNSIMLGGGAMFSGGLGQNGEVTGELSSGFRSKMDNTTSIKSGVDIGLNTGNAQTVSEQKAREGAAMMTDVKKWPELLAGHYQSIIKGMMTSMGVSEEKAQELIEDYVQGNELGVAGLSVLSATEAGWKVANYSQGKFTAKQAFSVPTGKFDANGNEIMRNYNVGDEINTKNNPTHAEDYKNNKGNFRVKDGLPGAIVRGGINGLSGATDKIGEKVGETLKTLTTSPTSKEASNEAVNSSDGKSNSQNNNQTVNSSNDKLNHNNSLNDNKELYNNKNKSSSFISGVNDYSKIEGLTDRQKNALVLSDNYKLSNGMDLNQAKIESANSIKSFLESNKIKTPGLNNPIKSDSSSLKTTTKASLPFAAFSILDDWSKGNPLGTNITNMADGISSNYKELGAFGTAMSFTYGAQTVKDIGKTSTFAFGERASRAGVGFANEFADIGIGAGNFISNIKGGVQGAFKGYHNESSTMVQGWKKGWQTSDANKVGPSTLYTDIFGGDSVMDSFNPSKASAYSNSNPWYSHSQTQLTQTNQNSELVAFGRGQLEAVEELKDVFEKSILSKNGEIK